MRSMAVAERKILNVMEVRCLRNMCEITCMDEVRNEEVCRTGGMREFAG